MTTYFTSDSHFGHAGVIAMSGRPFASIEEHDEALVAAWNAVVGPRDEVWHLGDFAMGASPERCAVLFLRLRGRKCLVRGNHDRKRVTDLGWHEQHDLVRAASRASAWSSRTTLCGRGPVSGGGASTCSGTPTARYLTPRSPATSASTGGPMPR